MESTIERYQIYSINEVDIWYNFLKPRVSLKLFQRSYTDTEGFNIDTCYVS